MDLISGLVSTPVTKNYCLRAVSGFEIAGHWVILRSPAFESGAVSDANEKWIIIVNISSDIVVFETNYNPSCPTSSVFDAVKSGMGSGQVYETFFAASMYDYTTTQTTIRHFEVDFVGSTALKVGEGPTLKSLDSIQAVEESIYYMAQGKKLDNKKGVIVLEIAGDHSLVEKRFISTTFSKLPFAYNNQFKKDIFYYYKGLMILVGIDSTG